MEACERQANVLLIAHDQLCFPTHAACASIRTEQMQSHVVWFYFFIGIS
jgi:hypothetical protein